MAGAAIIFGRYLRELTGVGIPEQAAAALTLGVLTLVNCLGVRAGSNVQSALMITKLAAILGLIGVGLFVAPRILHFAAYEARRLPSTIGEEYGNHRRRQAAESSAPCSSVSYTHLTLPTSDL